MTVRSLQLLRPPSCAACPGPFVPQVPGPRSPGAGSSHLGSMDLDKNTVHDQERIMEHLGVINKPEEEMAPQELQLHYCNMHDYDGSNLLDGLELSTATTDVHEKEGNEQAPPRSEELLNRWCFKRG